MKVKTKTRVEILEARVDQLSELVDMLARLVEALGHAGAVKDMVDLEGNRIEGL